MFLRKFHSLVLDLPHWTRLRQRTFGQDARGFLQARNQEHGQTVLRISTRQEKYRGGEGGGKLFDTHPPNSDF